MPTPPRGVQRELYRLERRGLFVQGDMRATGQRGCVLGRCVCSRREIDEADAALWRPCRVEGYYSLADRPTGRRSNARAMNQSDRTQQRHVLLTYNGV